MNGLRIMISRGLRAVLVAAVILPFAWPILLLISGAFKSPEQLSRNPSGLIPNQPSLQNFFDVFSSMPFTLYLQNTLVVCIGCVIGSTISCSLAAYSLARVRWAGRRWLLVTVLFTLLLPWQMTMIPRFVLISQIGLYNSLWAIILPCFFGDAFFIFLLRQFFLSLPEQLLDAGRIDGLGHWGIFWRIVLPLSKPAIVTVALFQFVDTWNNFGGPLLYLSDPEKFPLAYGLERYVSSYGDQTHLLLAASVLFSIPLVVIFFAAQRVFVQGITTSGLKE
ncbi:MAG: carbohydrate ABC transporter permease [Pirellulaceae bacterium]